MIIKAQRMQLCEILVNRRIITPAQVETALKNQKEYGGLIGENLIKLKFATEKDIASALAEQYKMPYISISSYSIDIQLTGLIPLDLATRYQIMPMEKVGNVLTVAISDPLDISMLEDIENITGCKVQVVVSTKSDINNAINKSYQRQPSVINEEVPIPKPGPQEPQKSKIEKPQIETQDTQQQKVIQELQQQLAAQTDDLLKVTKINSQLELKLQQQRQLLEQDFKEKEKTIAELTDLKNKLKDLELQLKNKDQQLTQSTQSYITLKQELDRIENTLELTSKERQQLGSSLENVNILWKDLKNQRAPKLNMGDIVAIVLSLIVLTVLVLLMVV